jgi:hypothetical protein
MKRNLARLPAGLSVLEVRRAALLVALTLALLTSPVSALAGRSPPGFFGVTPQDALTARDFARMSGVVGTLRIPIFWFACEPSRGEFDFGNLDTTIGRAADARIDVLPFIYGSPSWVAEDSALPPLDSASDRRAWAGFLKTLIRRYGPDGSFWRGRLLRRPIRRWQVWNEPNFPLFWLPRPSARGYARLLTLTARAIRSEDRRARIVMAGLAPVENGPLPWEFLRNLYAVPRIRHSFDVVGLHPYSASLDSLRYQVELVRATMAEAGDRLTPLDITEFGVASAGSLRSPMVKTPRGQATFLRRSFRFLFANRRRLRLSGAVWFTWRDGSEPDPHCVFCENAGLFDAENRPKSAWYEFRDFAGRAQLASTAPFKIVGWQD